jgi:hypothetical protein
MVTKLLEATAIINNKTIHIINTQMDIYVSWNIIDNIVNVKFVSGYFEYVSKYEYYTRYSKIDFTTDNSFKQNIIINESSTTPISALINFDTKSIQIKF